MRTAESGLDGLAGGDQRKGPPNSSGGWRLAVGVGRCRVVSGAAVHDAAASIAAGFGVVEERPLRYCGTAAVVCAASSVIWAQRADTRPVGGPA